MLQRVHQLLHLPRRRVSPSSGAHACAPEDAPETSPTAAGPPAHPGHRAASPHSAARCFDKGDFGAAEGAWSAAISADPDSMCHLLNRSAARWQMGDFEGCAEDAQHAAELGCVAGAPEPVVARALLRCAAARVRLGEARRAEAALADAAALARVPVPAGVVVSERIEALEGVLGCGGEVALVSPGDCRRSPSPPLTARVQTPGSVKLAPSPSMLDPASSSDDSGDEWVAEQEPEAKADETPVLSLDQSASSDDDEESEEEETTTTTTTPVVDFAFNFDDADEGQSDDDDDQEDELEVGGEMFPNEPDEPDEPAADDQDDHLQAARDMMSSVVAMAERLAAARAAAAGRAALFGQPPAHDPSDYDAADEEQDVAQRLRAVGASAPEFTVDEQAARRRVAAGHVAQVADELQAAFSSADALAGSFLLDSTQSGNKATLAQSNIDAEAALRFFEWAEAAPGDLRTAVLAGSRALARRLEREGGVRRLAQLRVFTTLLLNRALLRPLLLRTVVLRLCHAVGALTRVEKETLVRWWRALPAAAFARLVGVVRACATHELRSRGVTPSAASALAVLELLYAGAQLQGSARVAGMFLCDAIADAIDAHEEFQAWRLCGCNGRWKWAQPSTQAHSLLCFPFALPLSVKVRVFHVEAAAAMQGELQRLFLRHAAAPAAIEPYYLLCVRRERALGDALQQLAAAAPHELRRPVRVHFAREDGVDEGGVQKEFFQVAARGLSELFVEEPDTGGLLWFSDERDSDVERLRLAGKLVGLALFNGVPVDLRFPGALYARLLGVPLELPHLATVRPALARGLRQLLDFEPAEAVEDAFGLCFTAPRRTRTRGLVVDELTPGGAERPVTGANRAEYVALCVHHLLVRAVAAPLTAFVAGFEAVCAVDAVQLFRCAELQWLLCGAPQLSAAQLRERAAYDGGYSPAHPVVQRFWRAVERLSDADRARLVAFATGSDRVSLISAAPATIVLARACGDCARLPTAHTCFSTIMLPEYGTDEQMERAVRVAVENYEGFGLQ